MKAETRDRPARPAPAAALRSRRRRQRCQVACGAVPLGTSRAERVSETTSTAPREPRRASLDRKAVQNAWASDGPISVPSASCLPSVWTPEARIRAAETTRRPGSRASTAVASNYSCGRPPPIQCSGGTVLREGLDPLRDCGAEPVRLAPGEADRAVASTGSSTARVAKPLRAGPPDHRAACPLDWPAGLEEGRDGVLVSSSWGGAAPSLRTVLQASAAVTVALRQPVRPCSPRGAPVSPSPRHEPPAGGADRPAHGIGIDALLPKRPMADAVLGDRAGPRFGSIGATRPNREAAVTAEPGYGAPAPDPRGRPGAAPR